MSSADILSQIDSLLSGPLPAEIAAETKAANAAGATSRQPEIDTLTVQRNTLQDQNAVLATENAALEAENESLKSLLANQPPPTQTEPLRLGVNLHSLRAVCKGDDGLLRDAFKAIANCGISTLRLQVTESSIYPSATASPSLDRMTFYADAWRAAGGKDVLVLFNESAAWNTGNYKRLPVGVDQQTKWCRMIRPVIEAVDSHEIEIWNEVNSKGFAENMSPTLPVAYVNLLRRAAGIIWSTPGHATDKVITSGLAPRSEGTNHLNGFAMFEWSDACYAAGMTPGQTHSAIGVHPYVWSQNEPAGTPQQRVHIIKFKASRDAHGDPSPFYNTESGIGLASESINDPALPDAQGPLIVANAIEWARYTFTTGAFVVHSPLVPLSDPRDYGFLLPPMDDPAVLRTALTNKTFRPAGLHMAYAAGLPIAKDRSQIVAKAI
jgi:hypothetical protein